MHASMMATGKPGEGAWLRQPRARIGLIIPSVNRLSELQFHHFAPAELGIHVVRARITGKWRRPIAEMSEDIAGAGEAEQPPASGVARSEASRRCGEPAEPGRYFDVDGAGRARGHAACHHRENSTRSGENVRRSRHRR